MANYALVDVTVDDLLWTQDQIFTNFHMFLRALDDFGGQEGYEQGLEDGQPLAPTVAIVSPTPNVAPGEPGGFPVDEAAARTTPIVIEVFAPDGIQLAAIVVRYRSELDAERTVYRRGAFRRGFATGSFREQTGPTTWRFHCIPDGSWREVGPQAMVFDVDVAGGVPGISLSPIGASS